MANCVQLPERQSIVNHVLRAFNFYWEKRSQAIECLPIRDVSQTVQCRIPLQAVAIDLPYWAKNLGLEGKVLVPKEFVDGEKDTVSGELWRKIDWYSAIFVMLECWHERIWENLNGPIHSYSNRLRGWDARIWEQPWVNHAALFLREWAARNHGQTSQSFFGSYYKTNIMLTYDVDAIYKTNPIRLKQTIFNAYNSIQMFRKLKFAMALFYLKKAIRFSISRENWNNFSTISDIEKSFGLQATYNIYACTGEKSLKRWLFDPSYKLTDKSLDDLLLLIERNGHTIGIHPGFETWYNNKEFLDQLSVLNRRIGKTVTTCRQHWLRFSWDRTWLIQESNGVELDTTLMFNDRLGFRNASILEWHPWCAKESRPHKIKAVPSILMDSHLYDYAQFSPKEREDVIFDIVKKCSLVGGKAAVLWHPHTLSKDYGWLNGYLALMRSLENLMKQ